MLNLLNIKILLLVFYIINMLTLHIIHFSKYEINVLIATLNGNVITFNSK